MMAVPHYPESRPLELVDKSLLDPLFARMQPQISERNTSALSSRRPNDGHIAAPPFRSFVNQSTKS